MKRALKLNFEDGTSKELPILKATSVKTVNQMLHLDNIGEGAWRLIWNEALIPDFSKLTTIEVVRED